MNRNKRSNPYTCCDKCIEIKTAKENKDYQAYVKACGITDQVTKAEETMKDANRPSNGVDIIDGCEEWMIDLERDFNNLSDYNKENTKRCPFEFKPKLNRAIRVKYKLKCSSCGCELGCPACAIRISDSISPICLDCVADYGAPDDYEDRGDQIDYYPERV